MIISSTPRPSLQPTGSLLNLSVYGGSPPCGCLGHGTAHSVVGMWADDVVVDGSVAVVVLAVADLGGGAD